MTARPRLLLFLCGLVPTLVAAGLCLYRPSLFSGLESRAYDALVRSSPTRPPSGRVVIVDVDERSLSAVGQWPWRRDLIARLIGQLRSLGASTIALDIVFAEADRYEGTELVPDAVLADALGGGRVVLGYALTFDGTAAPSTACPQHALGLANRSTRRPGDRGSLLSSHWCRVQSARPDARSRRIRVSQRRARSGWHLEARALADGVRRSRLPKPRAGGCCRCARQPRHDDARGQCEHLVAHAGGRV